MRILITGANGYIGSRLCQYLKNQGHHIIAVYRSKVPYAIGWSDKIEDNIVGDLILEETIDKIFKANPDIIIHLVSLNQEDSEKNIEKALDINVKVTWKLLERCCSQKIKKFIYFSSIHAGDNENRYKEIIYPRNHYGLTHLLSEKICNYYNKKLNTECINVRLVNSYGEPLFKNSKGWDLVINELTKMSFLKNKIVLKSDGSLKLNFIHYNDICFMLNKLIENKIKTLDQVLYFQSDKIFSLLQVALIIKDVFYKRYKKSIPIYINENQLFKREESELLVMNNLISQKKQLKGIKNLVSMEKGINNLFKFLEDNF